MPDYVREHLWTLVRVVAQPSDDATGHDLRINQRLRISE